ncbi:hypothetical protein SAMN05216412_102187 [Nitrosospira multiformis]|uniref:Uncharacterized protein n=1 Tax=Nitrosospira multiformis TaxID=1231 RepID=A0A1I0ABQ5_9PROT|nr:hypothetical protein SAMN05216412_102187 [Nitrosospira multiformis]
MRHSLSTIHRAMELALLPAYPRMHRQFSSSRGIKVYIGFMKFPILLDRFAITEFRSLSRNIVTQKVSEHDNGSIFNLRFIYLQRKPA